MRFKEVWSDWRGGYSARQITMPGANVEVGGMGKSGAMTFQSCNNRYLTWYCCANVLELTEISLDHNLTDNAVDIVLNNHILSSSVSSCEADDSVILTVVTTAQIYWIELPHPQTFISQDMSTLSSITMDTIRTALHGMTLTVDTITSSISTTEGMFTVCNSKGGVLFMLSPLGGGSNVITVEVSASSKGVVQRMWQGLISSSATMATYSVVDLVVFSMADDLVAIASCHDSSLRLFSYKQQKVIMTYSLSEYVGGDNAVDVVAMVRAEQLTLMRFAIFLSSVDRNMVLIFAMKSSHDLHVIYSTSLSPEYSLVSWRMSSREIWMILNNGDGDTVVKHAVYKCGSSSVLMDVTMVTDPDLMLSDHLSPRECYLDHITLHYPSSIIRAVIMSMESSEVGSHDLSNMADLRSVMCHLVEAEIQQQVIGSCGPQEYRQHQLTQWDRLLGYIKQFQDEQLRPPGGLLIDSNTGLVLLLGRQCAGVMIPCVNPIDLVGMETVEEQDVNIVLQCVAMVTGMMTSDDKKMLQVQYCFHDDFDIAAASLADDIVARGDNILLAEFKERVNGIQNVMVAMETLVNYFDPIYKRVDERDEEIIGSLVDSLYAGDVAVVTMVTALRELISRRISLCQQVIIMFHLYKLVCCQDFDQPNHKVIDSLSYLLKCYHGIHWLTTTMCEPSHYSVDIDATLGRLDISDKLPVQQSGNVSLMESLLRGRLGGVVRKVVAKRLPANHRLKNNWRHIMPFFMNVTIETLWSSSWSLVCDLLLSNRQYLHAQTYLGLLPSKYQGDALYQFCLGQSLLLSDPDKSCDLFIDAVAMGITRDDEVYKYCHGNVDELCDPLLTYYQKVISLMEQMSSPVDHVIQIVNSALKNINDSIFQSLLFKQYLQLDQYEAAYNAMVTITDSSRQIDCLRHFVAVLIDEHQWARLCSFPFCGLENEVEDIIEARARSLDITAAQSCYELLYSYHVSHSNYRKGATVMYEAAHRTGIEVTGNLSLDVAVQYCKQRDYYAAALCSLKLCCHDYQWLVRPASNDKGFAEDLEVVTDRDISNEYHLVCAKCELLRQHPNATSELAKAHMSSQEVLLLLLQHGLFDAAFQLGRSLQLPLDTIYDNLAARCVSLTKSLATIQKLKLSGNNQSDYFWQWVGCNDPETTVNTKEITVVDNAWLLLCKHLMMTDDCGKYQSCVAKRIVSMGGTLPQWLVDHYKQSDTAGLLLIYLNHNMLEEALSLAVEYINAALGQGAEYFGIDSGNSMSNWLPHNIFGCLAATVKNMSQKLELVEVCKEFLDKWDEYLKEINKNNQ